MTATRIMMIAILIGVMGRWANNKPAIPSGKGIVQIAFATVVIAAMDQGSTQQIARGIAWVFLVSMLLANSSPLTTLARREGDLPGKELQPGPPRLVGAPGPLPVRIS